MPWNVWGGSHAQQFQNLAPLQTPLFQVPSIAMKILRALITSITFPRALKSKIMFSLINYSHFPGFLQPMPFLPEISSFLTLRPSVNRTTEKLLASLWDLENSPEIWKRSREEQQWAWVQHHPKGPWMPSFGANVIDSDLWFIALLYSTINNLLVASADWRAPANYTAE